MKIFFSALVCSLLLSLSTTQAAFSDVSTQHPHAAAINYVQAQGIVKGYDDGTFRPDSTINRAELVKIVMEARFLIPSCATNPIVNITDVPSAAWFYPYIEEAMCGGVVSGYPDGTFKPGNSVLVSEAAKIISKGFGDYVEDTGGAWYEGYINNLADQGALPTTISSVGSELTRGQMAEIIYRLKTGTTSLPSHTLGSLTGAATYTSATDAELDAQLDDIFDDLFDDGGELDLDSLLDL